MIADIRIDLSPTSDARPAHWPTAHALAQAFGNVIREWLTPEQLRRANRDNKTYDYDPEVCASHDYCDSNMAMLEAWCELLGIDEDDVDVCDDTMHGLWNEAWLIAKRAHFGATQPILTAEQIAAVDDTAGLSPILAMIAADPNVSPAFVAAISQRGSDRWREVRDEEDDRREQDDES